MIKQNKLQDIIIQLNISFRTKMMSIVNPKNKIKQYPKLPYAWKICSERSHANRKGTFAGLHHSYLPYTTIQNIHWYNGFMIQSIGWIQDISYESSRDRSFPIRVPGLIQTSCFFKVSCQSRSRSQPRPTKSAEILMTHLLPCKISSEIAELWYIVQSFDKNYYKYRN